MGILLISSLEYRFPTHDLEIPGNTWTTSKMFIYSNSRKSEALSAASIRFSFISPHFLRKFLMVWRLKLLKPTNTNKFLLNHSIPAMGTALRNTDCYQDGEVEPCESQDDLQLWGSLPRRRQSLSDYRFANGI